MPLLLISALLLGGCGGPRDQRAVFMRRALSDRPAMQLQDLYKLLYQGRFGVGHMIASREAARSYLAEEMAALASLPETNAVEPLLEPCSPQGEMVRVNLRPFAANSGDPEKLLDAMLQTARSWSPDSAVFRADWERVGVLIAAGQLPFTRSEYEQLTSEMRQRGYPAVHHSETYREHYRPAYRVVLRKFIE